MSISFNFCVQKSKMMYTNLSRHQIFFWSSKEKLTKDKVNPNHGEQDRILVMANFEINFLSYTTTHFSSNLYGNICRMSHTTNFVFILLKFVP